MLLALCNQTSMEHANHDASFLSSVKGHFLPVGVSDFDTKLNLKAHLETHLPLLPSHTTNTHYKVKYLILVKTNKSNWKIHLNFRFKKNAIF